MKILILTSINPVISGDAYVKIANYFNKKQDKKTKKIHFLCFPFFADIAAHNTQKEYLPMLFAMLKDSLDKDLHQKIYDKENIVVIGNTYKNEKFDMIISLDDLDSEIFDTYLETLKSEPELENFLKLININNLYSSEDAEINLPTIDHAILFLKEAFHGNKTDIRFKS